MSENKGPGAAVDSAVREPLTTDPSNPEHPPEGSCVYARHFICHPPRHLQLSIILASSRTQTAQMDTENRLRHTTIGRLV